MKPVVGIFAHPDDEIFAGGTLATFAKKRDVYLICVTNGEAGINSSNKAADLRDIRREELKSSAKLLGIKEIIFLEHQDGELSNNMYGVLVDSLRDAVERLDPEILITFEARGVSGHIDHMAVSTVTSYVFQKEPSVKELWYYCFDEAGQKIFTEHFIDFFVYVPPGYKRSQISKVVDASSVWEQKVNALNQHQSQKHDIDRLIEVFSKMNKEEYFMIVKKETE